jgi:hypothetical protein
VTARVDLRSTGACKIDTKIVHARAVLNQTWLLFVRFEVFTAVTMKDTVFWDVTPCGSCKNRRSASIIRLTRIGELGKTMAVNSN